MRTQDWIALVILAFVSGTVMGYAGAFVWWCLSEIRDIQRRLDRAPEPTEGGE